MWFGSSLSLDRRNCSFLSWVFFVSWLLFQETELWLWFKQGWTFLTPSAAALVLQGQLSTLLLSCQSLWSSSPRQLEPRLAWLSVQGSNLQ